MGSHREDTGDIVCTQNPDGTFNCYDRGECVPNQGCFDPTEGLCAPPIWLPQAVADNRVRLPQFSLPPKKR